jgi:hypothetical protein
MQTRRDLARIGAAVEALAPPAPARNTAHLDSRNADRVPLLARIILALGSSAKKDARAIACRRSFPIAAFVGPNGGGKTLCLIASSRPTRNGIRWECDNPDHLHTQRGETSGWRRMLSTVPILDGNGAEHPLYDAFTDMMQLVEAEHTDVYMDEVVSVASSRESQRMDARVVNKLVQLRKADVLLFWSAPNWARADKIMREVTQIVVECRGYFPAPHVEGNNSMAMWAPKRVFKFWTYDAAEFEEWTAAKREKIDPLNVQWFKGVGSEAFRAYDTLGSVSVIASITPEDTCTVCEGKVTRHLCQCHKKPRRPSLTPPEAMDVSLLGVPRDLGLVDATQ